MSGPAVIGIDVGTGGARAVAAGIAGELLTEAAVLLAPVRLESGTGHEQDTEAMWRALCEVVRRVTCKLARSERREMWACRGLHIGIPGARG